MKKGYKECPFCKNEIKKEAIKCQYCKEMLPEENQETKECPFCKNEIKYNAVKCQYCKEYIDDRGNKKESTKEGSIKTKAKKASKLFPEGLENQEKKFNWRTYKGRLGIGNFYKVNMIMSFCLGITLLPICLLLLRINTPVLVLEILFGVFYIGLIIYYFGFLINRRLKDRGLNLRNFLYCLIPIFGFFYLIYLFCLIWIVPGNDGENKYGEETDEYIFIKKRWSFGKRMYMTIIAIIGYLLFCFGEYSITLNSLKDSRQLVYYPEGVSQAYEGPFYYSDFKSCEEKAYIVKSAGWDVTCSFKCKEFGKDMFKCKRVVKSRETDDGETFDFVKEIYEKKYGGLRQVIYFPNGIDEGFKYGYGSYYGNFEKCKSDALKSKENHIDAACIQGCNEEEGGLKCEKIIRTRRTENGERFEELEGNGRINRDQEKFNNEQNESEEEWDGENGNWSDSVYCTNCENNIKNLMYKLNNQ